MHTYILTIVLLLFTSSSFAQRHRLAFHTEFGVFKVFLYDFTPAHRDLFLRAIETDVYKDALFNRIIENFVVQGGEHDIDIEKREAIDPEKKKPRLAPEFDARAYHKLGALGAGRDNNAAKASFLNQIYFVVGKPISDAELTALEQKKGIIYTEQQRNSYLTNGGQPRLDYDFTVFGEVYEGLEVLLDISKVKTDTADFPLKQIHFYVEEIAHAK
ncbi:peptidylprolyl isomerase [Sphingobacterium suaedae]|uniref:peptidylprolyl isomerase n=1 Tax=Sphingobacterium suaedae TaxID=1686402 RepID=A0ABW5KG72_9SPHI